MNYENIAQDFASKGFAVVKDFLSPPEVERLLQECSIICKNMTLPEHCSVFHTGKDQARDEYFIKSGDKISFFFEKDAVDDEGNLMVDKERALNKMGHALHWLNPFFKHVTFNTKVKDLLSCVGCKNPVVVQSMVIFKHPEIGGEVTPHQDSTFLYTDPPSAIGLWIPLVDISLENGCLWFLPGSHKGEIFQRYVRKSNTHILALEGEIPKFDDSSYVPVLIKRGDCVIIHGSVIHKSGKNTSEKSRPIYTFHVVEQKEDTEYSKENWLQPTEALPFPSVFSVSD